MTDNEQPNESEPADSIAVYRIRDELIELTLRHQAGCNDSHCPYVPNLIAYFAHSLGIKSSDSINEMERILDEYNRQCPKCTELN